MTWWKNEFYGQFGEDAIVHGYFRKKAYAAAGKLTEIGSGFYVDIGCHHPYMLSNTWFFYQRGWRGINVDPTPGIAEDFGQHRPHDTTLEIAVAATDGEATLYSYGRNVANTLDATRVRKDRNVERITVPCLRLDTLLDRHLPEGRQIDFLNVDVEGLDREVLASNDWNRFRPEVVVTELHTGNIDAVLGSDIYREMLDRRYQLFAWTQPSLVFLRRD